ncbi:MAG: hypothetical protein EOS73_12815 [Mesorhizobium sp.]|nr:MULTISPECIES: hypothetical protein [unclassified Mesorhizobium]RVD16102.1 hypothetical protein EN749_13650 [Mesorhizobium sp. M7A.F.Ca.ET.027.02.1.1]RWD08934.1 MAG: hypothetical protein EOS73_12815 [Mesorhizobium sp.]RWP79148.1 MAG: hypothetical protein EOR11_29875 [Mesorhizobium sp.]RWP90034.1 MAG: hypothetical protein EOR12_12125 [Mesorhizobium sp.]TIM99721.1 MAG: hypothetical protein E5Y34_14325 [Mesorhizobium sp.]
MDSMFFASWKGAGCGAGRREEDFWLHPPASGFGRLLAAVAIIGIAACLLDHAAAVSGNTDALVGASYGSQRQGGWK